MGVPDKTRTGLEKKKFRDFKSGSGVASFVHGITSGADVIPIKVEDDGSGLGELCCQVG